MLYQHQPLKNTSVALIMPIAGIPIPIDHGFTMAIPISAAIGTMIIASNGPQSYAYSLSFTHLFFCFLCSTIKDDSVWHLDIPTALKTNAV